MSTIITIGASVIAPAAVEGYESARPGGVLVHEILGRANPDVTLRVAGLRTGRLRLVFVGANAEADSLAAETAHSGAVVASLTSTDRPSVPMSYVVPSTGSVTRSLSTTTRAAWAVEVDFQEVTP